MLDPERILDEKFSTGFSMSCDRDVRGACFRMIFLAGPVCTGRSALGNSMGFYKAYTIGSVGMFENRLAKSANPVPRLSIANPVKTTEQRGLRGYDGAKKIKGRKRHILVDTLGLILKVVVHAADMQDRDGARLVLEKPVSNDLPRLQKIWADGSYSGEKLRHWVGELRTEKPVDFEIVPRKKDQQGFEVLPWRWIVERTFGWLGRCRRMSKEYERLPQTTEAFIYAAMIRLMLGRLAKPPQSPQNMRMETGG